MMDLALFETAFRKIPDDYVRCHETFPKGRTPVTGLISSDACNLGWGEMGDCAVMKFSLRAGSWTRIDGVTNTYNDHGEYPSESCNILDLLDEAGVEYYFMKVNGKYHIYNSSEDHEGDTRVEAALRFYCAVMPDIDKKSRMDEEE